MVFSAEALALAELDLAFEQGSWRLERSKRCGFFVTIDLPRRSKYHTRNSRQTLSV